MAKRFEHQSRSEVGGGRLSRRTMLRGMVAGLGGVAVGLPLLEAMQGSSAKAAAAPRRFVVFFSPNGTIPTAWVNGGTSGYTFGQILAPLTPHLDDIVVMTGVNNNAALHGPGDDHQRGMGTCLTGIEMQTGDTLGGCDTCPPAGFAGGISVDQEIAQVVGKQTKLASMEFGVHVHDSDDWSRMSYSGPGQPMPPVDDPVLAYQRLFAGLNTDPAGQKLLASQRKLVLDSVLSDSNKLKARLGAADKQKLEQHLESISQIEAHLSNTVTIGGACKDPGQPTDPSQGIYDNDSYGQIGKLQMDLLVMALTCDITRVASMQWTRSVGMVVFDWVDGCTDGHHTISHAADTDSVSQNQLIGINNWYAQQIKYLIESMKAIPEGNGTLFDNTAILWVNELAIGNIHSHNDMRYLIAGSCGGKIKTGRHLQFNGDPHNNLLLSMCQMMGLKKTTFGNPAYCTGPLTGLVG